MPGDGGIGQSVERPAPRRSAGQTEKGPREPEGLVGSLVANFAIIDEESIARAERE